MLSITIACLFLISLDREVVRPGWYRWLLAASLVVAIGKDFFPEISVFDASFWN